MAWVRYDDHFYSNPKVTAAVAEDVASLALHVLANSWTNGQRNPGFVPTHQPGILVCDRARGADWAGVLVRAGLWHDVRDIQDCDDCSEEYAHLPPNAAGYVFHNHAEYRAPVSYRTTPGTPADLSEKRKAAGSKGGRASAGSRSKQNGRANEANASSKDSNCSGDALTPEPVPEPVGTSGSYAANGRNARELEPTNNEPAGPAERILTTWIATLPKRPQASIVRDLGAIVADALHDGVAADDVGESLRLWQVQVNGRRSIGPGVLKSIIHQVSQRDPDDQGATPNAVAIYQGAPPARASTRDANVAAVLALANSYERSSP